MRYSFQRADETLEGLPGRPRGPVLALGRLRLDQHSMSSMTPVQGKHMFIRACAYIVKSVRSHLTAEPLSRQGTESVTSPAMVCVPLLKLKRNRGLIVLSASAASGPGQRSQPLAAFQGRWYEWERPVRAGAALTATGNRWRTDLGRDERGIAPCPGGSAAVRITASSGTTQQGRRKAIMKHKAHAVAAVLRGRTTSGAPDDEHPAESRQPTAAGQESPVRILPIDNDQDPPEVWPRQSTSQQTLPDDTLKDTARLSLLGIAVVLYLLTLIFILF